LAQAIGDALAEIEGHGDGDDIDGDGDDIDDSNDGWR